MNCWNIIINKFKNKYKAKSYVFWSNREGNGQSAIAFQTITLYAASHPSETIVALDLSPQLQLTRMLCGGGGAVGQAVVDDRRVVLDGKFGMEQTVATNMERFFKDPSCMS